MIYLIYGNQNIRIKTQTKAILKKVLTEIDELNYVKFDGHLSLIQDCIDEANFTPLGYDHKVVVVENCYFLKSTKERNKIESEQDYSILKKYISDPNPDCDLILTVVATQLDKKSDIVKDLMEKARVIEIKEPNEKEWFEIVSKYVIETKKLRIDNYALKELANRTKVDYGLLQQSVAKLSLYTDRIRYDDVDKLVSKPLEDESFKMFNYLMDGANSKAIELYYNLKVSNINPLTLISMISNQFRLLDQLFFLIKERLDIDTIAKELGINPIRAKILSRYFSNFKHYQIKDTLEELFLLDKNIKSGQVDRDYAFELFLINFKVN